VYNAIALGEEEMKFLEAFGQLSFLIVPGDHHRLDAKIWKDRYPGMQVVAPEGARPAVEKTVAVDTTDPALNDADVEYSAVPGTRGREAALTIRSPGGATLVLNDLVANIKYASGFEGWLLRALGLAGPHSQIPRTAKMTLIKDKEALHAQLLRWAQMDSLKRILVSHGSPIEENPVQTLRDLAQSLR
jgi:hypothetical protein